MRRNWIVLAAVTLSTSALSGSPQGTGGGGQGATQAQAVSPMERDVRTLLGRLDLEKYKATIKGLTQFGDRRQGTERNRKALDWIEAQLKSYGCPTERLKYEFNPPPPKKGAGGGGGGGGQKPQNPIIASGEVRSDRKGVV